MSLVIFTTTSPTRPILRMQYQIKPISVALGSAANISQQMVGDFTTYKREPSLGGGKWGGEKENNRQHPQSGSYGQRQNIV